MKGYKAYIQGMEKCVHSNEKVRDLFSQTGCTTKVLLWDSGREPDPWEPTDFCESKAATSCPTFVFGVRLCGLDSLRTRTGYRLYSWGSSCFPGIVAKGGRMSIQLG